MFIRNKIKGKLIKSPQRACVPHKVTKTCSKTY